MCICSYKAKSVTEAVFCIQSVPLFTAWNEFSAKSVSHTPTFHVQLHYEARSDMEAVFCIPGSVSGFTVKNQF